MLPRYTWRHDQVLKPIAEAISMVISNCRQARPTNQMITFLKTGVQLPRTTGAKNKNIVLVELTVSKTV
ncbi:unnamed protein product [Merluccius merluccius]